MTVGRFARELVEVLTVAVLLALFARTFLVQGYAVPSRSMEPTLLPGDHILVNKLIYRTAGLPPPLSWLVPGRTVRRGDLVIFGHPRDRHRIVVKRCVAVGSDRVEIIDKQLRINGVVFDESSYVQHADANVYPRSDVLEPFLKSRDNFGPLTVPDDALFCLGDNRDDSLDSRRYGTIPASLVVGRASAVYWSRVPVPTGSEIRWRRLFRTVQ